MKKSILLASCLSIAFAFSGCAQVNEFIEKVDVNDIASKVKIQEVSAINGITVLINNVPCNFSFTTDKNVVLTEVKKCMANQLLVPSMLAMASSNGEISTETKVQEPEVNEREALLITREIMQAIEK